MAGGLGFGALHFDQIRTVLGLKLEAKDFGMDDPQPAPGQRDRHAARNETRGDRTVVLQARDHGHFFVDARVNGRRVAVMVDTGASMVALTHEDAAAAGIFPREADFTAKVSTANGIARVAPVMLDTVSIDDITVRNVRAVVAERGRLSQTLLGMTFLGQLSKAEISKGTLTLRE